MRYKLNNWALISYGSPYTPPEHRRQCLIGNTEGHPEWEDGYSIVTSRVLGKHNGLVLTASGSLIELGLVREDYGIQFPDAKEKLLNTLPEIEFEDVV